MADRVAELELEVERTRQEVDELRCRLQEREGGLHESESALALERAVRVTARGRPRLQPAAEAGAQALKDMPATKQQRGVQNLPPVGLLDLSPELLLRCLLAGDLTAADLCRLELTAKGFRRQQQVPSCAAVMDVATATSTSLPTLVAEVARELAVADKHWATLSRPADESWLRSLRRLERGLRLTARPPQVQLIGNTARVAVEPPYNLSAVCTDHVMRSGVHRARFSIGDFGEDYGGNHPGDGFAVGVVSQERFQIVGGELSLRNLALSEEPGATLREGPARDVQNWGWLWSTEGLACCRVSAHENVIVAEGWDAPLLCDEWVSHGDYKPGDVVILELNLDAGTLTAFKRGCPRYVTADHDSDDDSDDEEDQHEWDSSAQCTSNLGVLFDGLKGPLHWCVEMCNVDDRVSISWD